MKINHVLGLFIAGLLSVAQLHAQERQISVMSWNVENLFDTTDDPDRDDSEFLPEGRYKWTEDKLALKMKRLANVITSVKNPDGSVCPDFIGMVEVEHAQIAQRLNREYLQACKYDKILADPADPDPRGIRAVSLTRLPLAARPISHVTYPGGRFIQEAKVVINDHLLVIFTNHWKSRRTGRNGDDGSDKRIEAGKVLRHRIDEILEDSPETDFIAMGDFNDEPENKSLKQALLSTMDLNLFSEYNFSEKPKLWNPAGELVATPAFTDFVDEYGIEEAPRQFRKLRGTYYYSGDKSYLALDNFHLSPGLLDDLGFSYVQKSYQVYRHPSMTDNEMRPIAFRAGANPQGVADHFPILLRLNLHEGF